MSVIDCSKCIHCEVCGDRYANDGHTGECSCFLEYNPSGDLISRKDLQAKHDESCAGECACCTYGVDYTKSSDSKFHCLLIDNAQAVFDDRAYSQGYKQGVCDERNAKPKGEWKHIGGDEWTCSECGHVITTEGSWENPLSIGAYHCENCGADMRGGAE